jgi:uncharacterized protein
MMDIENWSVSEWHVDLPFFEGLSHVHTPLCGDHNRVVVGVENSDESVAALRWAGREAQLRGTHLHVVHAWEPGGLAQRQQGQHQAETLVSNQLQAAFHQLPVGVESLIVESRAADASPPVVSAVTRWVDSLLPGAESRAAAVLVAASHGAALLVVGSHKHGAFGRMFKSVARNAATFATCPVAFMPEKRDEDRQDHEERRDSGRIVVGIDDSFTSREALRWAATESQFRGAELKIVHSAFLRPGTTQPTPPDKGRPRRPQQEGVLSERWPWLLSCVEGEMLARVLGEILVGPLAAVKFTVDTPIREEMSSIGEVLAESAADADVFVVGSHGYGHTLGGVRIGSVTSTCLHEALCPVVVIPESREDERMSIWNAKLALEQSYPTLYAPGSAAAAAAPGTATPGAAAPRTDHVGLEILPSTECLGLLDSIQLARVSFYADGEVVILPVNHVVDGQEVFFRTAAGSKLSAVEHHNPIALEADGYDPETPLAWSVLVKGRAEIVQEEDKIQRLNGLSRASWATVKDRPYWIRIRPISVTGRRTPAYFS